jgi:thiol-disulfide isomerase/thioredoxin
METRGLIASMGLLSVLLAAPVKGGVRVGDIFPPLAPAGLVGSRLPQMSGKVVLVDFWASWCAPCKASFPAYAVLNSEFASKGLVIVAISVDQDPAAYAAFVKRFNPSFPVELDGGQKLVRETEVPAMPTSYLMDREGRVRFLHPGFHGSATVLPLRLEIEALLAEKIP